MRRRRDAGRLKNSKREREATSRARRFSGPSVTLSRLSPGEGLRSVGEEILPLERAAVRLGVAAALCDLPAVPTGDTEAPDHEAGGGGPSGNDADAAPDSVDEHGPRLEDRARPLFCVFATWALLLGGRGGLKTAHLR